MKELRSLTELIESFSKLPGIGVKSAERMAYAVLRMKQEDRDDFVKAIKDVSSNIHPCPVCGLYTEDEKCEICANPARNHKTICVVSDTKDALAIEKMNSFDGVFHVLGGVVSPSRGIGPDDLNIKELLARVKESEATEVIIATNPTLDGETTALFIAKVLDGVVPNVTRLGYGLPMGSSLDYADALTLSKAFEGRKKI